MERITTDFWSGEIILDEAHTPTLVAVLICASLKMVVVSLPF
jgi:hypothetical protein